VKEIDGKLLRCVVVALEISPHRLWFLLPETAVDDRACELVLLPWVALLSSVPPYLLASYLLLYVASIGL
jgi:hypothetical protein